MITRFHVENFKALVYFDLPPTHYRLGKFTCLIGLNGSGKSTLLQAFDFVAHIVSGKVDTWLEQRNWNSSEVASNLGKWNPVVNFKVGFQDEKGVETTWEGRFNLTHLRCTYEKAESGGQPLLELEAERLGLAAPDGELKWREEKLNLIYKGSVLSVLQLSDAHPALSFVKESLRQLKSLELLSPQLLRRRSYAAKDIGVGGEKLSAFLAGLPVDSRLQLLKAVKQFYPHLSSWKVKSLRAGWKDLWFGEDYTGSGSVQAAHINDGLLRIMAILAQAHSPYTVLLFDEIENGINPELVEKLVDFLIQCGKQVIVTTHSPMILNYVPDDIAKEGVILLYRTGRGETKSARFFDLSAMQEKLRALGPGEVFADTRLSDLAAELEHSGNGNLKSAT
ncbi:MAG TPA: ATP-binding protein [Verrucomicrobiae bacterium]|nr:ATP-binding protein [Verrucomicrobiae bacterium]